MLHATTYQNYSCSIYRALRRALLFMSLYLLTMHCSTNIPPTDLKFQHRLRFSIPDATNKVNHIDLEEKIYWSDKKGTRNWLCNFRCHAKPCSLSVGDCVLAKQPRKYKLSSPFNPYPYCIITQKGSMFTTKTTETVHEITQNQTYFKLIPKHAIAPCVIPNSEGRRRR